MLTYDQALKKIHSYSEYKYQLSLCRITQLMLLLGNPQNHLKFIHIGGTNGKGSTAAMLHHILLESGIKVGLFTSPYIETFCERMIIGNDMIPKTTLCAYVEELESILRKNELMVNEFEFITALALLWFYREECDIVILEVGLGGEFDSTNVIEDTLFSVITSVSLDHMQSLGREVAEIAKCKSKIIKKNGIIITKSNLPKDALEAIKQEATLQSAKLYIENPNTIQYVCQSPTELKVNIANQDYTLPLIGKKQAENLMLALRGIDLLNRVGYKITKNHIKNGLKKVRIKARLECFSYQNRILILDGSHNAESIEHAVESVLEHHFRIPVITVFASMKDKDYPKSLDVLSKITEKFIITEAENDRGECAEKIWDYLNTIQKKAEIKKSPKEAILEALKITNEDDVILICGSFYLAGELRKYVSL